MSSSLFINRPSVTEIVGHWLEQPRVADMITAVREVQPRPGIHGPFPKSVHPKLIEVLRRRGIEQLYSHQHLAIESAGNGQNTVLVTPTASGKSFCFHLPVLSDLLEQPDGRALFLYPTKALTQDQYTGLHTLIDECEASIKTFTFDGDTPADARMAVRDSGQIVLTNPDMLHAGVLPQHTKWLKLFRNLRWVVLDELHAYKGVFGSHLCNVLRRLKRLCAFHGSNPTFIAASATIANPQQHAERLIEAPVTVIDKSGAPSSSRHVMFVNPPVVNRQLGIRRSYLKVTRRLVSDLLIKGVPTIVFVQSRLNVELLVKYLRDDLTARQMDPQTVQGYRGGYLPTRRRRIEAGLKNGEVLGVVSTNALELGIDIGDLTACVVAGYPGSVASVWQQFGRAGRRTGESLTVLVGRSTALDQYVVQTPEYFFQRSPEEARIDPDNLFILVDHVKCAAFELPFKDGEHFGGLNAAHTSDVLDHLEAHGILHKAQSHYHWMDRSYPANHVSLRRVQAENFIVIDVEPGMGQDTQVIAEVDFKSAHTTLYEHAIYNLDGRQFQVERLDYENQKAYVRQVQPDYFTYAHSKLKVQVLAEDATDLNVSMGEVLVTEKVVGFKKVKFETHENVGYGEVHLPEYQMHTTAIWLSVPEPLMDMFECGRERVVDALRGLGEALHTVSVLRCMCATSDLGRAVDEPQDEGPRLYIYDSFPGGVGFAPRLFELAIPLLNAARALIEGCSCNDGCPSCIGAAGPLTDHTPDTESAKALAIRLAACLIENYSNRNDLGT